MLDDYIKKIILDYPLQDLYVDHTASRNGVCCVCNKKSSMIAGLAYVNGTYVGDARITRICSEECLEYLKLEIC